MTEEQKERPDFSFWSSLPRYFKHPELQANFRRTGQGVFVNETVLTRLLSSYQSWLQEKTGATAQKSVEKCRRRLFGQDDPELFYVLDGKKCLAGYLIPVDGEHLSKLQLPLYQGNLMDTHNYIHPRDPQLLSIPGIKSILHPHEGLMLELSLPGGTIKVSESALRAFTAAAADISPLRQQYPALRGALRGQLAPLLELLKQAKPVRAKDRLLVPEEVKRTEPELLKIEALVFVVNREKLLIGAYGLNRSNVLALVKRELRVFSRHRQPQKREKQKRGKRKQMRPSAILTASKQNYFLPLGSFLRFLELARRSPTLRKPLGFRYTALDCLQLCRSIFEKSRKLEDHEAARLTKTLGDRKDVSFRKAGTWYFVLGHDHSILDCFQRLPKKGPRIKTKSLAANKAA